MRAFYFEVYKVSQFLYNTLCKLYDGYFYDKNYMEIVYFCLP